MSTYRNKLYKKRTIYVIADGIVTYYNSGQELVDGVRKMKTYKSLSLYSGDEKITNISSMFGGNTVVENIDLSNFNTSNVTDMSFLFAACINLKNINFGNFDTSKVTNMYRMFCDLHSYQDLDLSGFNTENVSNMHDMFAGSNSLMSINLNSFTMKQGVDIGGMFYDCRLLNNLDLSTFDTTKMSSIHLTFSGTVALTTAYVNNQTDANNFKNAIGTPSRINFIIKT